MDEILSKICKYFLSISENVLRKIYAGRCERLRLLMQKGIPEDIRLVIEAKVRLGGEVPQSLLIRYFLGLGEKHLCEKTKGQKVKDLS